MKHHLKRDLANEKLTCSVCLWSWKRVPVMDCPGVSRYDREAVPANLRTKTELRDMGLKAEGPARGCFYRSSEAARPTRWCFLYDLEVALAAHVHRHTCVEFDEETGVGQFACKCGHVATRTAKIMCEVPGAE